MMKGNGVRNFMAESRLLSWSWHREGAALMAGDYPWCRMASTGSSRIGSGV